MAAARVRGSRAGIRGVEGRTLVHSNYVTFGDFIERLNRYTSLEAAQALDRGEETTMRASLERRSTTGAAAHAVRTAVSWQPRIAAAVRSAAPG
jgi:hypothetical protein